MQNYTYEGSPLYEVSGWWEFFLWTAQIYVWILVICVLLYIEAILGWFCRGCRHGNAAAVEEDSDFIVGRTFDPFKFSDHKECTICLCEYEGDALVTVLPCDIRHYFHTECINDWSKVNSTCPLCKAEFTMVQIKEANRRLTDKI